MESQALPRKAYPTDVSEDEWAFATPYLTLMSEDAPQRHHDLREVFNALCWVAHTGAPWRYLPGDLPPWPVACRFRSEAFVAGEKPAGGGRDKEPRVDAIPDLVR
jgi:transposase